MKIMFMVLTHLAVLLCSFLLKFKKIFAIKIKKNFCPFCLLFWYEICHLNINLNYRKASTPDQNILNYST